MTDAERAALELRIDELCQENERLREQGARLFDKRLELGTENVKLREQLEYNRQTSRSRLERIDQLKDENAKLRDENANLRELVRMMWKSYCWANSGYETYLTDEQDVKVRNLVRKLGIEAPS